MIPQSEYVTGTTRSTAVVTIGAWALWALHVHVTTQTLRGAPTMLAVPYTLETNQQRLACMQADISNRSTHGGEQVTAVPLSTRSKKKGSD